MGPRLSARLLPDGRLQLRLPMMERLLLAGVLRHFPSVPVDYSAVSSSGREAEWEEREALRRESWEAHREEVCRGLRPLLVRLDSAAPSSLLKLELDPEQTDRLLQALNDVRVGAWLELGCPDPLPEFDRMPPLNPDHPRWRLVLAGLFEQLLVEALSGANPAGTG